jgi:thiamine biosynthesis lipoprotein
LVNWKDVVVDEKKGTLFLKRKGMQLDVGGVAKGFAMDEALAIARKAGVTSGIFNMGNSSIGLLGKKPGGKLGRSGSRTRSRRRERILPPSRDSK